MKQFLLTILLSTALLAALANDKDSVNHFNLPDSVKAVQFVATVQVQSSELRKESEAGIGTETVRIALEAEKNRKYVVFEFPKTASIVVRGHAVKKEGKGELEWNFDWALNESYKLLIAVAADSADNFSLYSGYIWLPAVAKWKLIGTVRVKGQWSTIRQPHSFTSSKDNDFKATFSAVWIQRNNNSWKNLQSQTEATPVVNVLSHVDSLTQFEFEKKLILDAINRKQTDVTENIEGVFYRIIEPGNGKVVTVNDTVTVFYRLTAFRDTAVIDEAKDKPATFPLKRLIRGWQLGVPLVKTGGKIKLVIPSVYAYSIRTRSPMIPPNSILEFVIEVVDTKPLTTQ